MSAPASIRDSSTSTINGRTPSGLDSSGAASVARILLAPPSIEREGVPPGEEKVIPLQEIPQDDNEDEVIVSWWKAVTTDGERRASEVRSLAVELP